MTYFSLSIFKYLSANPHKMIKHIQTIRRLLPMNCLSVLDHFVGLVLKGLTTCLNQLLLKLTQKTLAHAHVGQQLPLSDRQVKATLMICY